MFEPSIEQTPRAKVQKELETMCIWGCRSAIVGFFGSLFATGGILCVFRLFPIDLGINFDVVIP
jgi:hypothetical protein